MRSLVELVILDVTPALRGSVVMVTVLAVVAVSVVPALRAIRSVPMRVYPGVIAGLAGGILAPCG